MIKEECGVFAVYNNELAAELAYYGLHALQHRGQEGCGIVTSNSKELKIIKREGLITEVFNEVNIETIKGIHAIGHVRYSTAGGAGIENVQPFLFKHNSGNFALAHNGNLVNSEEVKKMLENRGSIFQSTSDSEILAHLIKMEHYPSTEEAIKSSLRIIDGGFAFLILTKNKLYACRDRHGLRPLSLGKVSGGYVLASETCAFDVIGATYVRDLHPGELVTIDESGVHSEDYAESTKHCMCAMEYIYFARPDSNIEGLNVHAFRRESGKYLARVSPADADIVLGVPDSSISAAIGFAEESHLPYEIGLIKNKYIGRTFIQPSQKVREKSVRMKLSAISSIVKGKRVVLIDDSIVRGTTSRYIIQMLREAGASEVHMRVASPQMIHPCFYGVDTSTYAELISARLCLDDIRKEIGADSLAFLPIKSLCEISLRKQLCDACFSGKYPTNIYNSLRTDVLVKKL